jgi:hypothetical protein
LRNMGGLFPEPRCDPATSLTAVLFIVVAGNQ